MHEIYVKMCNIQKRFHTVIALDNVSFDIRKGEVHAILGENGAGKSTLIKIMSGVYTADEGEILVQGKPAVIRNTTDANRLGISVIHQELCLATNMKVYENIFLGRENDKEKSPLINRSQMIKKTRELLQYLRLDISPYDTVEDLSIANQQMVEIAKALSLNTNVIIMDEPTSSLTAIEVETLFRVISDLKAQGISVVYISHRLEELRRIANRVTILRDGQYIETCEMAQVSEEYLITKMVGRELGDFYIKMNHVQEEVLFSARSLSNSKIHDMSFSVRRGEILGVSGLVGSGRSEMARAIFGIDRLRSGSISIEGAEVRIRNPVAAFRQGIILVPEDRKKEGLVLDNSVRFNVTISALKDFFCTLGYNARKETEIVEKRVRQLHIKTASIAQDVRFLSGGNQQKVVISKALQANPRLLILDEPTRGIDVAAKSEIYALMNELTAAGMAIIMISSDLPEIVNMSDRVLVVSQGRIAAELGEGRIDQETIMQYATGG